MSRSTTESLMREIVTNAPVLPLEAAPQERRARPAALRYHLHQVVFEHQQRRHRQAERGGDVKAVPLSNGAVRVTRGRQGRGRAAAGVAGAGRSIRTCCIGNERYRNIIFKSKNPPSRPGLRVRRGPGPGERGERSRGTGALLRGGRRSLPPSPLASSLRRPWLLATLPPLSTAHTRPRCFTWIRPFHKNLTAQYILGGLSPIVRQLLGSIRSTTNNLAIMNTFLILFSLAVLTSAAPQYGGGSAGGLSGHHQPLSHHIYGLSGGEEHEEEEEHHGYEEHKDEYQEHKDEYKQEDHGHSIGFTGSNFKTPVDVHHEKEIHLKAKPEYHYDYHVADHKHKDYKSKHETRDGYKVKGTYSLLEPDHKTIRVVDYVSDKKLGFIAKVSYKKHQ